ncbi:MAG TPA: hypothetical protein VMV94_19820 [Phycisphaerae bacterium]|nr:hypothetical protein [Phycisphaerae bacterium]
MNPVDDMPPGVDERTERLICRLLDGEISFEDRAELDDTLACNPAARLLLEEYRRIDAQAATALRGDFRGVTTAVAPGRRSGLWLATAGGLLAAAAVVALSFLPDLWSGPAKTERTGPVQIAGRTDGAIVPPSGNLSPYPAGSGFQPSGPRFADYRNLDQRPVLRSRDVQREWIGIPSADMKTIIIIERKAQTTKITPITGDF